MVYIYQRAVFDVFNRIDCSLYAHVYTPTPQIGVLHDSFYPYLYKKIRGVYYSKSPDQPIKES